MEMERWMETTPPSEVQLGLQSTAPSGCSCCGTGLLLPTVSCFHPALSTNRVLSAGVSGQRRFWHPGPAELRVCTAAVCGQIRGQRRRHLQRQYPLGGAVVPTGSASFGGALVPTGSASFGGAVVPMGSASFGGSGPVSLCSFDSAPLRPAPRAALAGHGDAGVHRGGEV